MFKERQLTRDRAVQLIAIGEGLASEEFARDLKDVNIKIGWVSFAIGPFKKKQFAIEEETQFLRNAQADAIVQIRDLKQELGELQKSGSTRLEECRCGSSSFAA